LGFRKKWESIVPIQKGGTLINYEDEDPQIRRDFETALREACVPSQMPPIVRSVA